MVVAPCSKVALKRPELRSSLKSPQATGPPITAVATLRSAEDGSSPVCTWLVPLLAVSWRAANRPVPARATINDPTAVSVMSRRLRI
jgi:hypothetical protein